MILERGPAARGARDRRAAQSGGSASIPGRPTVLFPELEPRKVRVWPRVSEGAAARGCSIRLG